MLAGQLKRMDGRQRSQKLSLETETPPSPNCLCKENTSCITKASQGRYLHAEQKVGRSWVKGFPLMNSRFEKAGRILLRGSGLERGRSGDKGGDERPLQARLGLWENHTSWLRKRTPRSFQRAQDGKHFKSETGYYVECCNLWRLGVVAGRQKRKQSQGGSSPHTSTSLCLSLSPHAMPLIVVGIAAHCCSELRCIVARL